VHGFARLRSFGLAAAALALALAPGTAFAAAGGAAAHQAQLSAARTTIQTMPPIEGAVFRLSNGIKFTTDATGAVQVPTLLLGGFTGHSGPAGIQPVRTVHFRDGGYAVPDGWWGTNGGKRPLTLGFKVYRPFTLKFLRPVSQTDPNAATKPVLPTDIDRVTLKSSIGAVITIPHVDALQRPNIGRPHLYQTEHVVSRQGGPYVSPIEYRLKFVYINGTNVVNSLQQGFCPYFDCKSLQPDGRNTSGFFRLIFYSARFTTKDMLFPYSIGQGVILKFPDGSQREYAFTSPGEVMISALPRGKYTVSVDAPGFGFSRPLTLTRDQVVNLQVVSYIDLAVFGVVFCAIVIGLLVVRRPHLLGLKRKTAK